MQKNKIKVGIHLPNKDIADVILSNPENGNPGIGGTQFLLWSLPYYIDKFFKDRYEFVFFVENKEKVKDDFEIIAVKDLVDAAQKAKLNLCNLIIYRPTFDQENLDFLQTIRKIKLKSIAWMHNTPMFLLNHLQKNDYVRRCVCVGREQYEKLRDHTIVNKLSMIYNAVDSSGIHLNSIKKEKSIVFLGSIEFAKGFHLFAKMWKEILIQHPDAELNVIGSGKLYDRNQKFGKLGVAENKYEEAIQAYICDNNGKLLDSVHFHGILGEEKYEIMSRACAGLTNHPYVSETFCLAAVEFQLCGTPVVSRANGGLLDTVESGVGGFLCKDLKEIQNRLIQLLSDLELSSRMGTSGRKEVELKFNYKEICNDWVNLIENVNNDYPAFIRNYDPKVDRTITKIRELLRKLKSKYKLFRILLPSIYLLHTIEFLRLKLERIKFKL